MGNNLKPCPFCGNNAEILIYGLDKDKNAYMVRCCTSDCCGRTGRKWADLDTAIYAWNRRKSAIVKVETSFYDKEEIHENCIVQVLTNTKTGDVSVRWWKNNG